MLPNSQFSRYMLTLIVKKDIALKNSVIRCKMTDLSLDSLAQKAIVVKNDGLSKTTTSFPFENEVLLSMHFSQETCDNFGVF